MRDLNPLALQGFIPLDTAAATAPGHVTAAPKVCVVTHCAVISNKNSDLRGRNQCRINFFFPEWLQNTALGIGTHREKIAPSSEIPEIISFLGFYTICGKQKGWEAVLHNSPSSCFLGENASCEPDLPVSPT